MTDSVSLILLNLSAKPAVRVVVRRPGVVSDLVRLHAKPRLHLRARLRVCASAGA